MADSDDEFGELFGSAAATTPAVQPNTAASGDYAGEFGGLRASGGGAGSQITPAIDLLPSKPHAAAAVAVAKLPVDDEDDLYGQVSCARAGIQAGSASCRAQQRAACSSGNSKAGNCYSCA